MDRLKFKSVLKGNRYSTDIFLPDFIRIENGQFSREKTLEKIIKEEYGIIDDSNITLEVTDVTDKNADQSNGYTVCGKARHTAYKFNFISSEKSASFVLDLFEPKANKDCNYVVHIDFRQMLPSKHCPLEEIIDNNLALAHFYYQDVSKDNDDFDDGLAKLFCNRNDEYSPGKIALWAYVTRKVAHYLVEKGITVPKNLYVAGHSRLGKTALLACAQDEIFAGCMVNNSGCCGAAISREKKGETLEIITRVFSFWFTPNFKKYSNRENEMPFDQHYLMAAVAPRKVFIVAADEDTWADTDAQYLCAEAASVAYEEQGLIGLDKKSEMLEIGADNSSGNIKFLHRKGPHFFSREDWNYYIKCLIL